MITPSTTGENALIVDRIIEEYQIKIANLDKQYDQMKQVYDTKLHSFYHFLINVGQPEVARWMVLNKIVIKNHSKGYGLNKI